MPGVFRPYTLADVLGTLNQQSTTQLGATVNGLGYFGETDETANMADSATGNTQINPTWDSGTWGTFSWS